MKEGTLRTYVKVDYREYGLRALEVNDVLCFVRGELETLMPRNICSTSLDFAENITGEDYIDFIGLTESALPMSDFEAMTDRVVLEFGQECISGLRVSVFVHHPVDGLMANYCYEDDVWK